MTDRKLVFFLLGAWIGTNISLYGFSREISEIKKNQSNIVQIKKELISTNLDLAELKRDNSILAAGIMELKTKDDKEMAYIRSFER